MDRRLFLRHAALVSASGLLLPACDPASSTDPPGDTVPLPTAPAAGAVNRFVALYHGLVRLPDGILATLDLGAYGQLRERVEVQARLAADAPIAGGQKQVLLTGYFHLLHGTFLASGGGVTVEGRLPVAGRNSGSAAPMARIGGVLLDPNALGDGRPYLERVSAPATTDRGVLRLSNPSADLTATFREATANVVQTMFTFTSSNVGFGAWVYQTPTPSPYLLRIDVPTHSTTGTIYPEMLVSTEPGTRNGEARLNFTQRLGDGTILSFAGVSGHVVLDASAGSANDLYATFWLRNVRIRGFGGTPGEATLDFSGTTTASQRSGEG